MILNYALSRRVSVYAQPTVLQGAISDTDEDVQLLAAALIGRLRLREPLAAAWEALAASTDGRRQAVHIAERLAPAVEPGDACLRAPACLNE